LPEFVQKSFHYSNIIRAQEAGKNRIATVKEYSID